MNVELKPLRRDHIEKKTGKLDRYLPNIVEAQIDIALERQKQGGERAVAQLTVRDRRGTILRAEDKSQADIFAAVDLVLDKMDEEKVEIVRRKVVRVTPMTEEEAIEQMELLGHDFFVFLNKENHEISVAYLREDGNYGILQPQLD